MKKNYIKFQRSTSIMGNSYKKAGKARRSTKMQMKSAEENKFDDLPEGLKKDTTTGFGVTIIEEKNMGGEIKVGKGGDYIQDLIK